MHDHITEFHISFLVLSPLTLEYAEGAIVGREVFDEEYLWLKEVRNGRIYFYDMNGEVGSVEGIDYRDMSEISLTTGWVSPRDAWMRLGANPEELANQEKAFNWRAKREAGDALERLRDN